MDKITSHFDNINWQIQKELSEAKESIVAAVAWFTDRNLMQALCSKAAEGVYVDLIVSNNELNFQNSTLFEQLIEAGGNVYTSGSSEFNDISLMHNKFCVIDYKTVITGSFNWTFQASRNDENIVIIRESQTAEDYLNRFFKLRDQSENYKDNENNDITITLSAGRYWVEKNEKVKIAWKVTNVDYVTLSDFGLVEASGSREMIIKNDKTIVIKGSSVNGGKAKTLALHVYKEPEICFKADKEFIINGDSIILSWDVKNADDVIIEPGIGKQPLRGTWTVVLEKSTAFMLKVNYRGKEEFRVVNVKVVPVPALKQINIPVPIGIRISADINQMNQTIPAIVNFTHAFRGSEIKLPTIKHIRSNLFDIQSKDGIKNTIEEVKTITSIPKRNYKTTFFASLLLNRVTKIFNH